MSPTIKMLRWTTVQFALIIFLYGCTAEKEAAMAVTTETVYRMQIDGTSFYNAYKSSEFIVFGFHNVSGQYEITASQISSTDINNPLVLNRTLATDVITGDNIKLTPSKISKKNIDKFIRKLKRKDNTDFNTTYAQYYVNIEPKGIVTSKGKNYIKIGICLTKNQNGNCTSRAKMRTNPCPPCRNSYNTY